MTKFCGLARFSGLFLSVLVGCSGAGNTPTPAPAPAADAGTNADASEIDAATPPLSACSEPLLSSIAADKALLTKDPADGTTMWLVRGLDDETMVTLTLREGKGELAVGQRGVLGEEQLTPSSSSFSLLVQTKCGAHEDHFHCGPNYIASSGSWAIRKLDKRVGGNVDIELSADLFMARIKGGKATPVAGAAPVCFRSVRLTGTLEAP
jgi:hypothetical protein